MRGIKAGLLKLIRGCGALLCRARGCEIGEGVLVNGLPYIRRKGSGRIVLGKAATINAARWANWLGSQGSMVLSAEDGATLVIGPGAGISSSQVVANVGIEIGAGSLIGAGCLLCDSDMHEVPLGSGREVAAAPIWIGRQVFIGARCIVLKGVSIGDGAVVGAGSVVVNDVPSGALVAGNPATVVKMLAQDVQGLKP